jgi:hypothetical protein
MIVPRDHRRPLSCDSMDRSWNEIRSLSPVLRARTGLWSIVPFSCKCFEHCISSLDIVCGGGRCGMAVRVSHWQRAVSLQIDPEKTTYLSCCTQEHTPVHVGCIRESVRACEENMREEGRPILYKEGINVKRIVVGCVRMKGVVLLKLT